MSLFSDVGFVYTIGMGCVLDVFRGQGNKAGIFFILYIARNVYCSYKIGASFKILNSDINTPGSFFACSLLQY